MWRHQAGQEEALVEVRVEMNHLEAVHPPRGSPADGCGCFKCAVALATLMGLVSVALVVSFILLFVVFPPSCNQDAPPSSDRAKFNLTSKLKDGQGEHDIFKVKQPGTYLIFVWVKFSRITSEEVILVHMSGSVRRTIDKKINSAGEMVFLDQVKMVTGSIQIHFKSTCTDSSLLVYEL